MAPEQKTRQLTGITVLSLRDGAASANIFRVKPVPLAYVGEIHFLLNELPDFRRRRGEPRASLVPSGAFAATCGSSAVPGLAQPATFGLQRATGGVGAHNGRTHEARQDAAPVSGILCVIKMD